MNNINTFPKHYKSSKYKISLVIFLFLSAAVSALGQNIDKSYMHHEVPDDPYKPRLEQDIETSPAYRFRGSNYFTVQVNVNDDGENILWDAANEPSISVDLNNPDRMIIGWRQFDDVTSNFRQAGYGFSTDAGLTWTFPEPIDPGVFRSDPVLDIDSEGNFYYNSLTKNANNDYWCDVFKTTDENFEWDEGTFAQGGDKQWMYIDNTDGMGNGNIYAFWNSSFSICYPGSYTRSTDGGTSYEECDGVMGNPIWGTLTVGPDGELYTVGSASNTGVVVTKSTTATNPASQTSWDYAIYVDLDGSLNGWTDINPGGLLGQVYVDADRSDGPGRGNVYVLASVDRDTGDPGDVMFARSTDGGQTWDNPIRINDDPYNNKWQWFGTLSVAPNGRIDAAWLDTRNAPINNEYMSELYYSFSFDEGITWSENERLSESFHPHHGWPNQNKMGDYFDMVSDNNGAHLAWANTINGEQDVYYTYITPWIVGVEDDFVSNNLLFTNYPNPVVGKTTLRYELLESSKVVITVFDILGNASEIVVDEFQEFGTHNILFDASKLDRGIYFCKLTAGTQSETIKLTVID
ncbi:MAG: T9SS type A sorting domain-containing protein [Bacteroidetes bacterium]|nr:T9SS type A sorting domain-containing protein [Bacteroidota bacterium]